MPKKPLPIKILDIDSMSHELRGVATDAGKKVFVRNAIQGETLEVVITRSKSKWVEGYATKAITAHPKRIAPFCHKADSLITEHPCGGCALQHMDQEMQLEYKQTVVAELLNSAITDTTLWHEPIKSPNKHYRSKARLGVRYNKRQQRTYVGFREAHSGFIADIATCPILHQKVGPYLSDIGSYIDKISQPDKIAQIEVAATATDCALIFRNLYDLTPEDKQILVDMCIKYDWMLFFQPSNYDSVYLHYSNSYNATNNQANTDLKADDKTDTKNKELLNYSLDDFAVTLYFHPVEFVQINATVNQQLVKRILDWLAITKNDIVFDLFCGIGNFTIASATLAKEVVALEGVDSLAKRCQDNATINSQNNVTALRADLYSDKYLAELDSLIKKHQPNIVILDPPRSGCQEVISILAKHNCIHKIAYISCNPHTLARDLVDLTALGFALNKISIADMFAHTTHIETLTMLAK